MIGWFLWAVVGTFYYISSVVSYYPTLQLLHFLIMGNFTSRIFTPLSLIFFALQNVTRITL